MKSFFVLFLMLTGLAAEATNVAPARALSWVPTTDDAFALDRFMGPVALKSKLGTSVYEGHNLVSGIWDFSVQGGAVASFDTGIHLPNKAIVTQVYTDTITAVTTSASGTLSLDANTAGDLKAALAAASYSGIQAGVPVGTAATMVKLTAARTITASIATGALTAGKVKFFLQYVISE